MYTYQVMIPCKDHVKKIAVYKDRLAVQLPERVVVYELKGGAQGDNASDMQYKKKDTINALSDGDNTEDDDDDDDDDSNVDVDFGFPPYCLRHDAADPYCQFL